MSMRRFLLTLLCAFAGGLICLPPARGGKKSENNLTR